LSQKQTSHPFEVHMVKVDALRFKMGQKLRIYPLYHLLNPHKWFLNTRPWTCIVVQNSVKDFA